MAISAVILAAVGIAVLRPVGFLFGASDDPLRKHPRNQRKPEEGGEGQLGRRREKAGQSPDVGTPDRRRRDPESDGVDRADLPKDPGE